MRERWGRVCTADTLASLCPTVLLVALIPPLKSPADEGHKKLKMGPSLETPGRQRQVCPHLRDSTVSVLLMTKRDGDPERFRHSITATSSLTALT